MHYIQKYILDKLVFAYNLRNRDMRPPNTESNLYQYHLKRLVDSGYIAKQGASYTLSVKGLQYADKHSSDLKDQRPQPKLVTILELKNSSGEVLLIKKSKQPFIGMYNLPSGKIHEGETLEQAGRRELAEKVGVTDPITLTPSGTVHLTIKDDAQVISESYGFVMTGTLDTTNIKNGKFVNDINCLESELLPGLQQIINRKELFTELVID